MVPSVISHYKILEKIGEGGMGVVYKDLSKIRELKVISRTDVLRRAGRQEALTCLRNAVQSGYKNVCEWVKSDPDLDSLHNDPEYEALVSEMMRA